MTSGSADQSDHEDAILKQLAEVGLVVPIRDPNRPHTKKEDRCGEEWMTGLPRKGGRPFHYLPECRGRGCETGAKKRAEWETEPIRRANKAFVGLEGVCSGGSVYAPNSDKITDDSLWITYVPIGAETHEKVRGRVSRRIERLLALGHDLDWVVVLCDGAMIVISTADLAQGKVRGRRALAPTSGWWCLNATAHLYLERVLGSTAVCGRVSWSKRWHPEDLPRKAVAVTGSKLITWTVQRILLSEGYWYDAEALSWVRDDPLGVLRDVKRRAEAFWADPKCAACDVVIKPDDEHWWRDGITRCGVCDLAFYLLDFLTKGRTEREIERRLHARKLTFKRQRKLIEEALKRTGAKKAPNGIWVPKAAQEDTA